VSQWRDVETVSMYTLRTNRVEYDGEDEMTDPELAAMDTVVGALEGLDEDGRSRVLRYASDRFGVEAWRGSASTPKAEGPAASSFSEVGELMHAARPNAGPERALVAGYWLQELGGRTSGWGGAEVNDLLKNMGHPLANVTKTLDSLRQRNPQLVMQIGKSGRSRQARKTYKLTSAGVGAVREMLGARQEAT